MLRLKKKVEPKSRTVLNARVFEIGKFNIFNGIKVISPEFDGCFLKKRNASKWLRAIQFTNRFEPGKPY